MQCKCVYSYINNVYGGKSHNREDFLQSSLSSSLGYLISWSKPRGGGGVLRFGSDGGVPLKPPNPYLSLRVILAGKGTHY